MSTEPSGDSMPTRVMLKQQKNNKKRLEILKSWMSSFVVTVAIVVVAVVYIPRSPKAEIISTQAFEQEIVYQVEVTDEDHALDLNTLKVVLSSALETYEVPITLGLNVGLFEGLTPNTYYEMKVYGSKGFGLENLASQSIRTSESPGGAIIGYTSVSSTQFDIDYLVDVLISDPESIYSSYVLYYGYAYSPDEEIIYTMEPITQMRSSILISGISAFNARVSLLLKGVTSTSEEVTLDEVTYYVPFKLESSVYIDRIDMNDIIYFLYPDSSSNTNVIYTFDVYHGIQKVKTIEVTPSQTLTHYGSEEVLLSGLKTKTLYRIEVTASYINPYTLRSESVIIHEEEATTLPTFTATIDITEFETYYEVEIFVTDPNHLFQIPYYTLFELSGDQTIYLNGEDFGFTPEAVGKRSIFTINKPLQVDYQLIIGIRNTQNYTIRHILYDEKIQP